MQSLALCLADPDALAAGGGLGPLLAAMALAGLAGGVTHCAGMCAPFVLAQGAARAGAEGGGATLARLAGAALLPYHFGRMLGYGALGAFAGGAAGLLTLAAGEGARAALALPLLAAAAVMLAQGCARLGRPGWWPDLPMLRLPALPRRVVGGLLATPGGLRGVALGLLLSALPCGLLYGALAGAAAAGSALGGALAMAAFAAGTVPALVAVGLLGRIFARRFGPALRPAAAAILLVNAALLGVMAARVGGLA